MSGEYHVPREGCLTLALSGEAAVVSAKPAGSTIGKHQGEPDSGLVRFNAWLDRHGLAEDPDADAQAGRAFTSVMEEAAEYAIEDLTRKT
jgi:hypothetical protein